MHALQLLLQVRLPANVTPRDLSCEKVERFDRTRDSDGDVENEFYETRQSFLSLCQVRISSTCCSFMPARMICALTANLH